MTGLEELKKEIMKKVREVIDNVDEFKIDVYFHTYYIRVPDDIEDEIICETIYDLINREEFVEFLEDLKYEIENEKIWFLKCKDGLRYLLEGIINFDIFYDEDLNDFYIDVEVHHLELKSGILPMKDEKDIAGVSPIDVMWKKFKIGENVKKKLLLYVV